MTKPPTDEELLIHYRLIVPHWLYFSLLEEYERANNEDAITAARRILKEESKRD